MEADPLNLAHLLYFLEETKKTWSGSRLSSYVNQAGTKFDRSMQHPRDQLANIAVILLMSSLCCGLHAQVTDDYITSETNITTVDTKVLLIAPLGVITRDKAVFTTGITIRPIYIQAPTGLYMSLTIQCKGGQTQLKVPDYVANTSVLQIDHTGVWRPPPNSMNANGTWYLTGLGIRLYQNISVTNNALFTLGYSKHMANDIAGKATMTIILSWNVTVPSDGSNHADSFMFTRKRRIFIWAPTTLTSFTTFHATVVALCLLGIFIVCCLGCLNTVAIQKMRAFSVQVAKETRHNQECEQNRVFNPLWIPCAPTRSGYYNVESTPNSFMLRQRRAELKAKILRMSTPFSLIDRLTRVRHLRAGKYAWVCRCPGARALPMQDSSSDDEQPLTSTVAASKGPTSATSTNRANKQSSRCLRPSSSHIKKPHIDELVMAGGIVQQRVPFRLKGSRSTNEEEEEESTIEE
ncbi:uncharacterized protein [Physcomitrium patens]